MDLEWDEDKRQWTLAARGLDFADIEYIEVASFITQADRRFDYGKPRYSSFAYLDGRLINFCWTPRGNRIRIISMRKANDREQKKYDAR